jgi:hypothetical protein
LCAQSLRGRVLDQTGLPLPGVTVQLVEGKDVLLTTLTTDEGTFEFEATPAGSEVVAALDGFETATVPRAAADRIVMFIAHAADSTTVVAPVLTPASPTTALLGNDLHASDVARLPSTRLKARESLPLLPSVVRGPDGLVQLGGSRPQDTPLLLDGFNITDPATNISSINLPFEAVQGIEALRDPTSIAYAPLMGGVVRIESRPGGDDFKFGVQGFVPRPRFASPGFGRLEGIFPRVFAGGSSDDRRVRYFTAVEYDYERIPVPQVTGSGGPDLVESSAVLFGRLDVRATAQDQLVVEALAFPRRSDGSGLSPRREAAASLDVRETDYFGGVTARHIAGNHSVYTLRVSVLTHDTQAIPKGAGVSLLTPDGWRGNWFATLSRQSARYAAAVSAERSVVAAGGTHDLLATADVSYRRLTGSVAESSVRVEDSAGVVVRTVDFTAPGSIRTTDVPLGAAVRDVWHVTDRVQLDAGGRVDYTSGFGGPVPSARSGVRIALDSEAVTVLKVGYGSFVGSLPLAVESFASHPTRVDRRFDPATGQLLAEVAMRPAVEELRLPRASAVTTQVERQLAPGLDAQVGFTTRHSTRLATLDVPQTSGAAVVRSTGRSGYHEAQISLRKAWRDEQKIFASYVRSAADGELNDSAGLFRSLDPLLQPGGRARLSTDARHRVIAWGSFNLPMQVVVSPVVEWRSGFPYSSFTNSYLYAGSPNSNNFPAFTAVDVIAYKTFTLRSRSADLGIQLFNAGNHFNPRDVYAVTGTPRYREFTNSVGPILRGFMMIKW